MISINLGSNTNVKRKTKEEIHHKVKICYRFPNSRIKLEALRGVLMTKMNILGLLASLMMEMTTKKKMKAKCNIQLSAKLVKLAIVKKSNQNKNHLRRIK
jgi:hypothetical protein